jgi:DNA-binding beta-propeller fold protein YncE
MKAAFAVPIVIFLSLFATAQSTPKQPFILVRTIEIPDVPLGPYADHPTVDVKSHRIFATTQAHKSVKVFDLDSGKEIHDILGIENPHSVFVRDDLDTTFITDGGAGELKVYRGLDYQTVKSIKLELNADGTRYDPATKLLYVDNGGKDAKLDYSLLSIIDTTTAENVGDIKFPAQSLEAIAFEKNTPRSYINLTDKNQVAVFDRKTKKILAIWPLTKGRKNIPITLDERRHRLFVGCRNAEDSGVIVIIDTRTGKEIDALPIAGWVDELAYDAKRKRIYAACGKGPDGVGSLYAFQQDRLGGYHLTGNRATAPMAKAGVFVPELDLFLVSVPHNERTTAKILIFKVQ